MKRKYLPIIRNRDEKGIILTYSVFVNGIEFERNTLKEIKVIAVIIEDDKVDSKGLTKVQRDAQMLLDRLKLKHR